MGQVIDAGELGLVEFPDGMSDADINTALHQEMNRLKPSARPVMGTAEGMLRDAAVEERLAAEEGQREARLEQLGREVTELGRLRGQLKGIDPMRQEGAAGAIDAQIRARGVEPLPEEKSFGEVAVSPLVPVSGMAPKGSDFEAVGLPKGVSAVAAGALQGASGLVEFFTSPLGIATLGVGALPAKTQQAVSATFAADMARHAPEQFAELGKAVGEGRLEDAVRLAIGAAGTVYFAGKSAEHAVVPGRGTAPSAREVSGRIGAALLERIKGTELEAGASARVREVSPEMIVRPGEVTPEVGAALMRRRGEFGEEIAAEAPRADAMEPVVDLRESVRPIEEWIAKIDALPEVKPGEAVGLEPLGVLPMPSETALPRRGGKGVKKAPAAATVETPVQVEQKVQEHVTETAAVEGKRPAKEVKTELVQRLEEAMEKAPSPDKLVQHKLDELQTQLKKAYGEKAAGIRREIAAEHEKFGKITIQIPGDGTFTIVNTKAAVGEVLKRAQKLQTSPGPRMNEVERGKERAREVEWTKNRAENELNLMRGNTTQPTYKKGRVVRGKKSGVGAGREATVGEFTSDFKAGEASVFTENYAPTPADLGLGGMEHVRPVEMPEIVRLARELSGQDVAVQKLASALGVFKHPQGNVTLDPKVFKDPVLAGQVLAHEVGHLVDYLPENTMKRGNLLGRLAVLRDFLKHEFPAGENLANAKLKEVYAEAYELSKWWRPIDEATASPTHLKYRKSSKEIYADAISVLFNAPNELKARAPKFWEMFFNYLERKPAVKKAFVELQEMLAGGASKVTAQRLGDSRAAFMRGEEILQEKIRERQERRNSWKGFWRDIKTQNVDQAEVLRAKVESLKKAGVEVPQWMDPRNAWEESLWADNRNMLDVERIFSEVVKPVEDAGLDLITLGQVLELQRIIGSQAEGARFDEAGRKGMTVERDYDGPRAGSRVGIANPQGLAVETARNTLAGLYGQVGAVKAAALEAASKRFRKLWLERAGEGFAVGIYSERMWNETIVPNADSYVAFRALDHIETFVTPMARKGLGTLKDVENPFVTTMYKLAALNNLIATQRAKIAARDFFRKFDPAGWQEVPERVIGKGNDGKLLREPTKRKTEGLERLEMLENGRVKVYDVDPYVAKAFERLTPAESSAVLKILGLPFSNVVYPLIIKYNPAFQLLFNPMRDFQRSWKNIGAISGMSPWQFARNYVKAFKSARGFVKGDLDPLAREMLEQFAMGTPLESWSGLDRFDAFGELMQRYKMAPGVKERNAVVEKAMALPEMVAHVGGIFEALPKMAAYRALVKEGVRGKKWSAGEAAPVVRTFVGTPNFKVKGVHGNVNNVLVPFMNIFLQGYRADAKVMTSPKTAGGYWTRWALTDGASATLMGLASAGALGGALQAIFGGVSEYDKSNYAIVPIGFQPGGDFGMKTIYLRLPRDETSRFVSAATYKLTRLAMGDKSARKVPTEIFDVGAGIVPTVTPLLQIADGWRDYLRGQNPVDPWKGRPVVGETEFKAGGWESLKPMMIFTLDKLGVVNFVGWNSEAETVTELAVSAMPGIKRLVKVSDYGYREQQREAEEAEERQKAIMRLDYPDGVRELLAEYYRLQGAGERRTAVQETRYAALKVWHTVYSRFDETSWTLEQAGQKARAKEIRQKMGGISEQFEREGKLEWAPIEPIWKQFQANP